MSQFSGSEDAPLLDPALGNVNGDFLTVFLINFSCAPLQLSRRSRTGPEASLTRITRTGALVVGARKNAFSTRSASSGRTPKNSFVTTGFSIVATMAGVGVLGMPTAVATSGWVGLVLLLTTAVIAMITANLLGAIMTRMPQASIRDYTSLAGAAFGRPGVIITNFTQYVTLGGVSVIFLLLSVSCA